MSITTANECWPLLNRRRILSEKDVFIRSWSIGLLDLEGNGRDVLHRSASGRNR